MLYRDRFLRSFGLLCMPIGIKILMVGFFMNTSPIAFDDQQARLEPENTFSGSGYLKIAVPAYFYPGQDWLPLEQSASATGIAIVNPNSGPGMARDPNYARQITTTRQKGIRVIAYVSTSYGGTVNAVRTLMAVEKDIDRYYHWYPDLDGIFIDEVGTDCGLRDTYYQPLHNYIKRRYHGLVVLNPGTNPSQCYMNAGDIIINFEDTYAAYQHWKPADWVTHYAVNRFWHLIHATSATNLQSAIALARKRYAGWVYATPYTVASNPWRALPPTRYWQKELEMVTHP